MLLHHGLLIKMKLLQLFNNGWMENRNSTTGLERSHHDSSTKKQKTKKGKDKSKVESYQPVSLTSCVGKLTKCLSSMKLTWHPENKKHITPEQAAFRQDRSTKDQITYISQATEDALQDKQHTFAVWIDIEKAFVKVWKEGEKFKLRPRGVVG